MEYGCQSMTGRMRAVLIKRPEDAFIGQRYLEKHWQEYKYTGCPDYDKVIAEYNRFEEILKQYADVIYYLPRDARTGMDSIYAHDSLKITSKGAVYFPMGKALRAKESIAAEEYLLSIGVPTLGRIEAPAKIEGGDVLWIDERTVAIGRNYRTNQLGINRFRELTRDCVDEYIIVPMPHGDGEDACLHLMSIISFVDTKKAAVYSRYMPVPFREFLLERGIELIECGDEEYDMLGTNILCLAPGVCVMMAGCPEMADKLRGAGIKLLTYEGMELSFKGTGGPTCLTCPILRE